MSEPVAAPAAPVVQTPQGWRARIYDEIVVPLASIRLTVTLLALSILLVFFGTLAQIDQGIWTVVSRYFRSIWVWVPLQIFFPRAMVVGGGFVFPGGWLLGGLLLANLIAAHAVRFAWNWQRAGIILIHLGIILLLVGELATGLFAVEANMTIDEGSWSNYVEDARACELAIVDPSDPQHDEHTTVSEALLRAGGLIRHEVLPFDVRVEKWFANSRMIETGDAGENPASAGAGQRYVAVERPPTSGTDTDQKVDVPSLYATLIERGSGKALGTWLFTLWLNEQHVEVGGKHYDVALRNRRTYKPYTLHLIDFKHDKYMGTEIPKNFSSHVRVVDPGQGVDREVLIYMNHPLRYAGETFYQSSFKPGDTATILQVVRNPGWLLPYIACGLVTLGMLAHFGLRVGRSMGKKRTVR